MQISLHPVEGIRYSSKHEQAILVLFQGWWCLPKSNYFWLFSQVCHVPLLDQTTRFGINNNLPIGECDKYRAICMCKTKKTYTRRIICV